MVVLLIYMTAVVVILLNILIAQMSSTYTKAKKTAKLQYDADRMLIITRLEHSRFRRFVSFFFFFMSSLLEQARALLYIRSVYEYSLNKVIHFR